MKLLKDWTQYWTDNDFMEYFKRLNNLDNRFVRQIFRLFLHKKNIDSFETFQEKIVADNDFLNDFQLDETLFELTIESSNDECFYSMIDEQSVEKITENNDEKTFTKKDNETKEDNGLDQVEKIDDNAVKGKDLKDDNVDDDRNDNEELKQNDQDCEMNVEVDVENGSFHEQG